MQALYVIAFVLFTLFFWTQNFGEALLYTFAFCVVIIGIAIPLRLVQENLDSKLNEEVARAQQIEFAPINDRKFDDLIPPGDLLFFEIDRSELYEVRRSGSVQYIHASLTGKSGPARLRIGNIGFSNPETFSCMDKGRLIVTSKRLIFQGGTRRHEWPWTRVGDIRYDRDGLLIWPRNGRPKGLRLAAPDPRLYAFIEKKIGALV